MVSTYAEERERNFAAYDRLKDELVQKYAGQYVAIADGRLVKVSPDFDEAKEAVRQYRHRLVFRSGSEPLRDPVYIR